MRESCAIELVDVCKSYGAHTAVHALSLGVHENEVFALVGGSGSGKTTTLKMINRLVTPTRGRVRIDGRDVREGPAFALRRSIGYVFQQAGLFPHMTVAENVCVPLSLVPGRSEASQAARVLELLSLVELSASLRTRYPSELSGGQAQRVALARALAAAPRIMLLDEPFSALDPITRDNLQEMFSRVRRELSLTAVLVTHDVFEASLLSDRIGVMRAGRLVQVDTPAGLARAPSDEYVARLVDTPRRQATALRRALGEDAQ